MKFNINKYVKVKLTDFGIMVLKREGLHERTKDDEGYQYWQLWELMNIFGKYLYNGSIDHPIELEIVIPGVVEN